MNKIAQFALFAEFKSTILTVAGVAHLTIYNDNSEINNNTT